jgi:transcriptional regulator with XRE-family HTH domain
VSDAYLRRLEAGDSKRVGIELLARLALALGIGTDDLLCDIGLGGGQNLPEDLGRIYDRLGEAERRAWVRMGEVLADMRQEQERLQAVPHPLEPIAAYSGQDLERLRRREGDDPPE